MPEITDYLKTAREVLESDSSVLTWDQKTLLSSAIIMADGLMEIKKSVESLLAEFHQVNLSLAALQKDPIKQSKKSKGEHNV